MDPSTNPDTRSVVERWASIIGVLAILLAAAISTGMALQRVTAVEVDVRDIDTRQRDLQRQVDRLAARIAP